MKRNICKLCIVVVLFNVGLCSVLVAEETSDKEKQQEIRKERLDTLNYGIDSEVVKLLQALRNEEKNEYSNEFNEVLLSRFDNTRNRELKTEIIKNFTEAEYTNARDAIRTLLEEYPTDENLVGAAIDFFVKLEDTESLPLIIEYMDDQKTLLAVKSVNAVGYLGDGEHAALLKELFEDEAAPQNVRAAAISAIGRLEDGESMDFLIDILENPEQPRSYRWRACEALGIISDKEGLSAIKNALYDDDEMLRTYAVRALQGFDSSLVYDDLIAALRDSFWRVRLAAIETLGERQEGDAVEILAYKATRDPENNIRLSAVQALGEIGGTTSYDTLREIALNNNNPQSVRITAIDEFVQGDLARSFDAVDEIIKEEWPNNSSRIFVELVKSMTAQEHPKLEGYFERFLSHNNVSVVLMSLKGIEKNRFTALRERVEQLSEAKAASSVRKTATQVLDSF